MEIHLICIQFAIRVLYKCGGRRCFALIEIPQILLVQHSNSRADLTK